jgi:hypothetical protein
MRAWQTFLVAFVVSALPAAAGTIQVAAPMPVPATHLWLQPGADAWLWQTFTVKLPQGETRLTYPFAAGDVDFDSIRFELVGAPEGVSVIGRTQDPAVPRNVTWIIDAAKDAEVRVRLGHYLKGIAWRVDYTATVDPAGSVLDLQADLTLTNGSKKPLSGAAFRLPDGSRLTASLDLGQTTQFPLFKLQKLPFSLSYVYDVPRYGDGVFAILTHLRGPEVERRDKPILAGHVRVQGADAAGVFTQIGEADLPYTPAGEKLEFRVTGVPELTVAKSRVSGTQVNIKNDVLKKLALFDLDEEYTLAVKNRRGSDVTLVLRDNIPGAWEMLKSSLPFIKTAADQIEFRVPVAAGQEVKVGYTVRRKDQQP